MGLLVDREEFEAADYARFTERLKRSLTALRSLLERPDFGEGPRTLGAELEVSIVDAEGAALPLERSALPTALGDITLELDRFNLEYNLAPLSCADTPFSALERQLAAALGSLGEVVGPHGGRVVPVGILQTLRPSDLQAHAMTDLARYRALSAGIRRQRRSDFTIEIQGEDRLVHSCDDVTLEGAGTSFQVHLRVAPREFSALYNACQLATPVALAVAANSPVFLGHRLWDETRIALFKQSIDERAPGESWRRPARVSFGQGWVHGGAYELFAEATSLFAPLLPVLSDEDPLDSVAAGGLPALDELRLHQGTVWRWNRAIYDPSAGGHLRIELRGLPSGPTPRDMSANAAFLLGLTAGLAPDVADLLPAFPFELAHYSFYRAAQSGLDAQLLWPSDAAPSPRAVPARELAQRLLPVATEGLASLGVAEEEAERMLDVIRARLESDTTPARWQRRVLSGLGTGEPTHAALVELLGRYLRQVETRRPAHEWSERA